MQYCRRCKAWIENPSRRCPLCQGVLEGEPEPEGQLFPDVTRTTSGMEFGFRVFTFLGRFCCSSCWMHVGFNSSGTSETPESAEKYIMADGIAQWNFFIMGFSYRVSRMVPGICNSYCDSSCFSYSYGNGEGDELAGCLLYGLLYSGLWCRDFPVATASCRDFKNGDSMYCMRRCFLSGAGRTGDFPGEKFLG